MKLCLANNIMQIISIAAHSESVAMKKNGDSAAH